ncbi:MAG TPA: hypothetical protein VLA44_09060 [Clostridia bacterium]|nr:hypothetical protein [Clostridia bacterium]
MLASRPAPATPTRARRLGALSAFLLLLGVYLAAAPPVAACDCMGLEPMAAYAGVRERVIFSGTVQALEPGGVPVLVTRWFQGPDAAGIVMLKGTWGLGGASCETPLPPAGTEWIFVAWRNEAGELEVNLCTPHAALGTEAGDAMLADAVATFGGGGGGGGGGSSGNPGIGPSAGPVATPAPTASSPPEAAAAGGIAPGVLAAGGVAVAGLLAGLFVVGRKRRADPGG